MIEMYLRTIGDAFSQLGNAVFFNSGNANESISGRCYRQEDHWFFGRLRVYVDLLFSLFGDNDHCQRAYYSDLNRARSLIASHEQRVSRR